MPKALIVKRADGGVTVFRNPPDDPAVLAKLIDKIKNSKIHEDTPGYAFVNSEMVDDTKLPPYDEYRNAWGHDLKIRIDVARQVHADRIRLAREDKLKELDIAYDRADEVNDAAAKAEIVRQKNVLRDAPADPRIAAATTVAQLRAIWPAELGPAPAAPPQPVMPPSPRLPPLVTDKEPPKPPPFAERTERTSPPLPVMEDQRYRPNGPPETPSSPESPEAPQEAPRRRPRAGHKAGSGRAPQKGKGKGVSKVAPKPKRPRR